jgi:SAM-dependent methyltransferase
MAIDSANASFWNELCGSAAARAWGITDESMESLRRFDENYLKYYPYLDQYIPWVNLRGKSVLEVGLGYGTVSQKLAESGAFFTGLDIADNPVAMVTHRLRQSGLPGEVTKGNILEPPFADGSFDAIVAIGCLHHTGDIGGAIESCRRLLAPGGILIGMVYYAYSYRRWLNEPSRTTRHLMRERWQGFLGTNRARTTFAYDHAQDGTLAPSTEFVSISSLRSLCNKFARFHARTENAASEYPFIFWTRDQLLASPVPRLCGLDLYWTCVRAN